MGDILVALGLGIILICVFWLYGIGFSKGWEVAIACILIPFTLVILIIDEQGQKAWGCIFFGAVLAGIGFYFNQ